MVTSNPLARRQVTSRLDDQHYFGGRGFLLRISGQVGHRDKHQPVTTVRSEEFIQTVFASHQQESLAATRSSSRASDSTPSARVLTARSPGATQRMSAPPRPPARESLVRERGPHRS